MKRRLTMLYSYWAIALVVLGLLLLLSPTLLGVVIISARQVGIVVKNFSTRSLPAGRLVALNGEAGYQAETLPPGLHFFYWRWQYHILKAPVVVIPQGEIGLVVAADGASIPANRILGQVTDCDNFQDARKFLENGGEKGRQLSILTAGTYRINTIMFKVITAASAVENGMEPEDLLVHRVEADMVGIVTTLDGAAIEHGEIAGAIIPGHESFQNAQVFIDRGGCRGLQEQVLLSGTWNLNPWFARVEQVPMTQIPIGYVGVVISFVGKAHEDVSGLEFKHGDLVNPGHKGVWVLPLYPGKHPLNVRVLKVELVPTTNIVLNWATRIEAHSYDSKLSSITVRSKDGFAFNLDVSQIIHVGALDAPKVISRVGSMQNLVDHVLQPIVGNYFRNAAQNYTVLDFLGARSERQEEAAGHIRGAIGTYDVQAIDTLIGDINPPESLMTTLTDRKLAEEQQKTYEVQEHAQKQRQQLVRETAQADIQQQMVQSEQGVRISELQANSQIQKATGEAQSTKLRAAADAEAIRAIGQAKGDAYRQGVESLGKESFTAVQLMQIIGEGDVRVVPDVAVTGGNGSSTGLVEALMGMLLRDQVGKNKN
ncbi:MAG: flotillin family protein [Anaerolineae bacterium]|nr:MAG: flotillin family protein [Anaerolineae bacterium]